MFSVYKVRFLENDADNQVYNNGMHLSSVCEWTWD